jgi:hypothetical protein
VETRPPPPEARRIEKRAPRRIILQDLAALCIRGVAGGKAMRFLSWHVERSVDHPERVENALVEELLERLAGNLSNEIAQHVGGD